MGKFSPALALRAALPLFKAHTAGSMGRSPVIREASDNIGQVSVSMFSASHYRAELGGGGRGGGLVQEKDTVE